MLSHRSLSIAALGALLLACTAPRQTPVPLVGAARDVAALEGQWDGSYSSAATGDSAFGDVVMIPRGLGRPLQAWNNAAAPSGAAAPRPAVLTINFVRVAEGRVTGTLAPYADPETGVQLFTAFEGHLRGDVIEGTYTTRTGRGVDSQTGEWKVTRRKS